MAKSAWYYIHISRCNSISQELLNDNEKSITKDPLTTASKFKDPLLSTAPMVLPLSIGILCYQQLEIFINNFAQIERY